ncbi:MAG: metallophosphoesterase [Succinivibrio sp.]|nr:metallophosphoesterase [Succinivibrio sp.]
MLHNILFVCVIVILLVLVVRAVLPLTLKIRYKFAAIMLILLMCSRAYVDRIVGGSIFDPQLSRIPLVLLNSLFCTAIGLVVYCFLRDICNIPIKVFRRSFKKTFISVSSPLLLALMTVLWFALSCYACANAWMSPEIHEQTIYLKNLPESAENYRIAFLADMHINRLSRSSEIEDYVNLVNAQHPDLILIGGDFQDGRVSEIGDRAQILYRLKAKDGIYACEGNHEIYWDYEQWKGFYGKGGIVFLDNSHTEISRNGQIILTVAGVLDTASSLEVLSTVHNARKEVPLILLSHRPSKAGAVKGNADLVLSGHTHGGMAPGLDCLVALANSGYVAGQYYLEQGTKLWVSRGTSMWQGFALRLFNPAEILFFTLKRAD